MNDTESDEPKKNKKKLNNNIKKQLYCSNCGKSGHAFKNCTDPITSYGFVGVKIDTDNKTVTDTVIDKINNELRISSRCGIKYVNENDITNFSIFTNKIKFLLIRRKHSLGFMEFVRGRYKIDNINAIIYLFKQMIQPEINKIGQYDFDLLWKDLWGEDNNKDFEYKNSKEKFEKLKEGGDDFLNLKFYIEKVKPQWESPEWGFPKGRRNYQETDLDCAMREFEEETNIHKSQYNILSISPLEETFIGTNGIQYKHIYFMCSMNNNGQQASLDSTNKIQTDEIGDIGWFTYNEVIERFRPYHTERIKLLSDIYITILNIIIDMVHE